MKEAEGRISKLEDISCHQGKHKKLEAELDQAKKRTQELKLTIKRSNIRIMGVGPGAVAQVVKGPRLARPGSHMGAGSNPGQPRFPSSSLPVAWESSGGRPKALGTCTHVGDPEEAPGFGPA